MQNRYTPEALKQLEQAGRYHDPEILEHTTYIGPEPIVDRVIVISHNGVYHGRMPIYRVHIEHNYKTIVKGTDMVKDDGRPVRYLKVRP